MNEKSSSFPHASGERIYSSKTGRRLNTTFSLHLKLDTPYRLRYGIKKSQRL
ncbi:hypothetical protein HMPREF1990_02077 [Porphyromonas gingivalis W4087]|nr:hypothetical protein HMPREF1990_02077 [Porphyromonas gingivalis W4087]